MGQDFATYRKCKKFTLLIVKVLAIVFSKSIQFSRNKRLDNQRKRKGISLSICNRLLFPVYSGTNADLIRNTLFCFKNWSTCKALVLWQAFEVDCTCMRVSIKFSTSQNLLFTSNDSNCTHIYSIHVFALSIDLERRDTEILLPVCISKARETAILFCLL